MDNKIIGTNFRFDDLSNQNMVEFNLCIADLIENERVQRLKKYYQHKGTSRFEHSMNVAYYSFRLAKLFGADPREAARAGFLHDMFMYNWHSKNLGIKHSYIHPKLALRNAEKITFLSKNEKDAILNHMWPLAPKPPKSRESLAVNFADKYSTVLEVAKAYNKKAVKWVQKY